jgi:hypothetical protein
MSLPPPISPPAATPAHSNRPFFIVGSGRSGTTLLRLMLSGHSRLHVSPETWFIEQLVAQLPVGPPLTGPQRETALTIITTHYRWPDLGIAPETLRAEVAALPEPKLRDVTDAVYSCLARAANKLRIGDKTPVYVRILPQLAALYPDAQFIHLLRDGRDVALSFMDAHWAARCYDGASFEWTAAVRAARSFGSTMGPQSWMEIRYEDLVHTPEPVVRRLCTFLGEAFEPAMLDTSGRTRLVPEREQIIHRRVSGPIDAGRAGAWQARLKPGELFVLESCLGTDLRASGYPLHFASAIWSPFLRVARLVLIAIGPALTRGVPALKRRGLIPENAMI